MVWETVSETCCCGAKFTYAGGYFSVKALERFREVHAPCRAKYAEEVKTCEPSPGVTVTHGG